MQNNKKETPRGIRNNNPMNVLRFENSSWVGMSKDQPDSRFLKFDKPFYGYRAGIIIIARTYHQRGWRSIAAILEHYAPSTENNTKAYIKAVVSHVQNAGFNGIGKLTELPAPSEDSRRLWVEIVIAIHNVECEHWPHDRQVIEDAFNYVFHLRK